MSDPSSRHADTEWRYARAALAWHGWGSPVGVGIGLVCLGLCAVLVRMALVGP